MGWKAPRVRTHRQLMKDRDPETGGKRKLSKRKDPELRALTFYAQEGYRRYRRFSEYY